MTHQHRVLLDLLARNPHLHAAWYDPHAPEPTIHALAAPGTQNLLLHDTPDSPHYIIEPQPSRRFHTLLAPLTLAPPRNQNQKCQDEPIELGTQIQPEHANWFGTAGSPCKWRDPDATLHWGILSNWHVMANGDQRIGRTQHQPTISQSAVAKLSRWHEVTPDVEHNIDAAIADALIGDYHTISDRIIGIGTIGPKPLDATIGQAVAKSGRTTGVTYGTCTAVGAAVQVDYGDFTATLWDQDIYSPTDGPFSGPGDSGSLIVGRSCRCPCSLLFAGNEELTVGNPIRHINSAFNLVYPFP